MKESGIKRTVIWMMVGLLVNYAGKMISNIFMLPLWIDSIGTGITASILGPVFGALCGLTSNLLFGITDITQVIFCITNMAIGVIIGLYVKKGKLEKFFGVLQLSALIAGISIVVSTPLSCIFWNGFTGNVWGSAVFEMLRNRLGWSIVTCSLIGQVFVEIPDKFVTVCLVYLVLQIYRKKIILKNPVKVTTFILGFLVMLNCFLGIYPTSICAENLADTHFSSLYSMVSYNSENGLNVGEANDVVQTSDGYLWIGTYAGLYSYNGIRFTLRNDIETVKNVNCLYVDEPGRLWIGTNDSGITLLTKGKVSSVLSIENGLTSNSVRCIKADNDGNYYIGTSDGLCICTLDNGLNIVKKFDEIDYATHITIDDEGRAVVVNNSGELFFIEDMKLTSSYHSDDERGYYAACCFTKENDLLIADSKNCIYRWNYNKKELDGSQKLELDGMQSINEMWEDDGIVWVCCDNGIGYINEDYQFEKVDTGDFNSSIDHGMVDYQGNLWFSSSRLGLLKMSKNTFANLYQQAQLSQTVVNSVTMWNGNLYSGTDSGLDILDIKNCTVIQNELSETLKGNRIRCLKVDSSNHLWICVTDGEGLYEVLPDGQMKIYNMSTGTVDNRFRSIMELQDGSFAVAENTGITFINNGEVTDTLTSVDGLSCPQILSLAETSDGKILAGSDGNGIFVIEDHKVVEQITQEKGLSSEVILRIVPCKEGFLIVTGNGLCYMNKSGAIKVLDQFPYFNNYDAFCADEKIWILGSAGFYIGDIEDVIQNKKVTYEQLDQKSGFRSCLTANAWNYVDESGNAYFCCNDGVYSIDVFSYNAVKVSNRMRVDHVVIDEVEYAVDRNKTIEVESSAKRVELEPMVFNYTLSNPYLCYYLEGFEDNKTIVRQSELSTISYTNLPAGTYTLHLELLDATRENILESCSYTIVKETEFWENWWFTLYFILTAAFIVSFLTYLVTKSSANRIIEGQKKEIEFAMQQARMGNETILAIARTVDAKDENTSQHAERVAEYSVLIAKRMGWSDEKVEALRKVALLHDIGKIGIPDSVLKKPEHLTDEEYAVMKSHVVIGGDILKDFSFIENVADGAKYHHERYDGKGYVMGLKGEEIPINARIIGAADAFDAMTSNRVYRKHLDIDYVVGELRKGKGKQFDPNVVDVLLSLIEDGTINIMEKYQKMDETQNR